MNGTLVIARREIVQRRFVFLAAAAFALLSLIIPLLPGIPSTEERSALVIASLIFAAGFTATVALILGGTIVGRELSDGRLSFYFSRPVPAAAIWFGKLAAALVLIGGSFLIVASPALIAGVASVLRSVTSLADAPSVIRAALLIAFAAFLIAHVIGTLVRSHSAWIVIDFVAAAACGAALLYLLRPLLLGAALTLMRRSLIGLGVFTALAVIAAGAWQLAEGRTDRKRSHRELSQFLWMAIGAELLLFGAFVLWVTSVRPSDLRASRTWGRAAAGSWAVIGGEARHRADYHAAFLYNVENGRAVRLRGIWGWGAFSGDGKVMYWTVPAPFSGSEALWSARLDVPRPRPMSTGVDIPMRSSFVVSEDGSRIAFTDFNDVLSVIDVPRRALLASVHVQRRAGWMLQFVRPDLLRFAAVGAGDEPSRIFEFDVVRRRLVETGQSPKPLFWMSVDHAQALSGSESGFKIVDARTGANLHSVAGRFTAKRFLHDGRIAAVAGSALELFSPDGLLLRSVPISKSAAASLDDAGDGRLVVISRSPPNTAQVVDIDRGSVVRTETGLVPIFGASGRRLLCRSGNSLVVWDTATGERKAVR